MINMCSESLVKATVRTMGKWFLSSGKLELDQMSLLVEACKLALITRWEGQHHIYFWKYRISEALLSLVVENFHSQSLDGYVSLEEEVLVAEKLTVRKSLIPFCVEMNSASTFLSHVHACPFRGRFRKAIKYVKMILSVPPIASQHQEQC